MSHVGAEAACPPQPPGKGNLRRPAAECYSPAMTAITIQGLSKRFGQTTAVDSVDLSVESGELFFLLGPSGCGKTTLLRMIAGFIEPTAGRIFFGNRDITPLPPNHRNTGMVFQSYALWPHMTVAENVGYGLNVRKRAAARRNELVTAALRTVRMSEYARRKPNELSGGQQQRVALARALVIEPTVLLLDEPLSNLDAKLRLEMRSEIRRICSETKITTVYVTHDQKEALSMADRVAVLDRGRVMQVGAPRELYDRPGSRFVADFLGETNFIAATVSGTSPRGGNVTCSLRPEALRLANRPSAANCLSGKMLQTIYLGEVAQHLIELSDGTVLKALELNPDVFTRAGEEVYLTIDPDDVVILPD
jgi:iron(III) transport system ATP-binding protein